MFATGGVGVNIEDVEGIGPEYASRLRTAGVATTDALLERGASAAGRAELAATTEISSTLLLEWVNHADLMRIDGVGSEYSDLLEAAGVDSPAELAQRNAANLAQTFQELDAARPDWIRSVPSEATVAGWIAQAKILPKVVTHGGGGNGAVSSGDAPEAPVGATAVATPAVMTTSSDDSGPRPSASAPAATAAVPGDAGTAPSAGSGDDGFVARIRRLFGR
jgi:predicted flap endonuclease-1-like 5' DNA nuclease